MTVNALELEILRMLRRSTAPLSGRQVAEIAGVAPNTANRALNSLQERGLVRSAKEGRAIRWTTTADVADLRELADATQSRVALVVTAVELEHAEVRNRLLNVERVRTSDIWMLRGEVPGQHLNWTVYLARAGMGNATSAALVGLAARDLKANVVAFVGSAGGLKPGDHNHQDVVVASRIHNPYAGKQVSTENGSKLLGRDKTYSVPAPLLSLVNTCIEESAWTSSTRNPHYEAKHPHAYVAPIVSVEAVQTDPDGPVIREVRERFQDAAALDMESFGLAAGSDIHDLPVLVVRGLSDFLSDKPASGNDDLQPDAAGNAAQLLRDILSFAHPDDFKRGATGPSPAVPPADTDQDLAFELPQSIQMWMDRLSQRSVERSAAATHDIAQMRKNGVNSATWLGRALHRPPAWLREDDTGDGWALMSALASLADSKVAWRGYERAASCAQLTGDGDAMAYFTLTSQLERIVDDAEDSSSDGLDSASQALSELDQNTTSRFGTVIEFYRAVLERDLAKSKARAEVALATLGLTDPSRVLRSPEESVKVVSIDPALRDLVATAVLRQLARMMLAPGAADDLGVKSGLATRKPRGNPVTRDLADDGLHLAQWAVSLRPYSEGARLTLAQTTLGVLVSMSGRTSADVEDEISRRARAVEADAMQIREVFTDWGASAGSALAVAARARSLQGDFLGALRLLLPPPDGVASQRESRHPEVVRLAAFIARVAGKDELALELASKIPDRVEAELMRAAVLGSRLHMGDEAKRALFAALSHSERSHHSDFQAVMALCRQFNSLTTEEQTKVQAHIEVMADTDGDLADVMRARVALTEGDPDLALRLVRGLERNELALEAHADALVALGRADDAAMLVFDEGVARGDIPLATEALEIAVDNSLTDTTRKIALTLLGREDGKPVRHKAMRALQQVAAAEGTWNEAVKWTEQIIAEATAKDLPIPEAEYWRLAEALYFEEKYDKALQQLMRASAVSFNDRGKAQLFFSILSRVADEQRARGVSHPEDLVDLGNPDLYALFMRAAAQWADDEQIAALAMSLVLTGPDSSFTDHQVDQFREFADQYFKRHGENATIKQIQVEDDDLEPLLEFLRQDDARQQALEALTQEVRADRFPLAVLTEAAGRTCTESLIRRDLGYVIAVAEDDEAGMETARAALNGRVVADTSALVVAPWTGSPFKKVAAHFESVVVPPTVRADVSRARSGLAMRSTSTLGWDTRQKRPILAETSLELADAYAEQAEQVWVDVQSLQVIPLAGSTEHEGWLGAVLLAQQLNLPVWADDAVLRKVARSMGIRAFGSLDLIRASDDKTRVAAAVASLRDHRVVDLPIDEPWHGLAVRNGWSPDSPLGVAIARPAAWRDVPEAFDQFRSLIRLRPVDAAPAQVATWTHLAATGLALAARGPVRTHVVSSLLAWAIIFADPFFAPARDGTLVVDNEDLADGAGELTGMILEVADDLRAEYYPEADAVRALIEVLCRVLMRAVGPEGTSRIIGALVERLGREVGSQVFAAYIGAVGN